MGLIGLLKQDLQRLFGRIIEEVTRLERVDLFEQVTKRAPYAANRLQGLFSYFLISSYSRSFVCSQRLASSRH